MEYTNKFVYQSNQWYNDGLKKANIRDLSGAIASLRKSLQFNRANIAARNLLGLLYYGKGEVAEALVEWIISNNMQSHGNIAKYYIKKVQENAGELDAVNQAIHKYNQCLVYCQQGGEDLAIIQLKKVISAHPSFLKAYQLLALLYLHTEQYAKARQMLRRAHKLDITNDITLTYMHEITRLQKQREVSLKQEKEQAVSYHLGNETIIQPVSSTLKENAAMITILNIVIGIALGAAVVWFLIVPSVKSRQAAKTNQEIIQYSDQIAAQQNEIDLLQQEIEAYEAEAAKTEAEKKTAQNTKSNYENLIKAIAHYQDKNYSLDDLETELLKIDADALGNKGKEQYDAISADVFEKQCRTLYAEAKENYESKNYKDAITKLGRVIKMQEKYGDGEALLLLADSYKASGKADKAKEKYERVIKLYEGKEIATRAEKAMNAQTGDDNAE